MHRTSLVFLGLLAIGGHCLRATEPITLGSRRELFVDTFLIRELTNARQALHHPVPREVVLRHDVPWEGNTCCYHTVFRDGDLYRMYYRGSHFPETGGNSGIAAHPELTCYAESRDGIHWTRPELGFFEFQGSKANNIVLQDMGTHCFAPFKDSNPDCIADARYKAISLGKGGLHIFKSPDGLRWSLMHDGPVITKGAFDSQNLAFYDNVRKRYVDFHRFFSKGVRDIMTCTSDDFITWTDPLVLDYGDAPAEHLYTNQITAYHRAPHIFMGFPKRFMPNRRLLGNRMPGLSDGVFMTSRDGVHFHRWTEAFIRPGPNRERWFNRNNMTAWGIVETATDIPGCSTELSFYSTEAYYERPVCRVRRFTLRLDGFVSVQAPLSGGTLTTRLLTFSASEGNAGIVHLPDATPAAIKSDDCLVAGRSLELIQPTVVTIPDTCELGRRVTLAAHIRGIPPGRHRLFSAYNGGPVETGGGELVFDLFVDKNRGEIRFGYSGPYVYVSVADLGNWIRGGDPDSVHHLAATWDDGLVRIYVDGKEMAKGGKTGGGEISLKHGDLRFGEDYPPTSIYNEPFLGHVDDILVLRRCLSAEEIARMTTDGAQAVVDPGVDSGVLYTMESPDPRMLVDALPKDGASNTSSLLPGPALGSTMLLINASTSAAGSIRCEILDALGDPIPGFSMEDCDEFYGDRIEWPVSWHGTTELSRLAGTPIVLRFELTDADLYAIRFGGLER